MRKKIPDLLQINDYILDKDNFTLKHHNQRCDSSGRKRHIECICDVCQKIYTTYLQNERKKQFPWHCKSCAIKRSWQIPRIIDAHRLSITDELREKRRKHRSITSLKMWNHRRDELCQKMRNRDPSCYMRGRKKMRHSYEQIHWKTGSELTCIGSYELAFVDWCNKNQIDFDWQVVFKMPDDRVYIIDAYIKTGEFANTWIEIKGWLRGTGKQKWEWFHNEHLDNSQLWNLPRLRQLRIIT